MSAASFATRASRTSLGLLADNVLLAVERLERGSGRTVPADVKHHLAAAREFIDTALDKKSRSRLAKQVDRKAVRSAQAYQQAMQVAARATGHDLRARASQDAVRKAEKLLRTIQDALKRMEEGQVDREPRRDAVRDFFSALSDMTAAQHRQLTERSVIKWETP